MGVGVLPCFLADRDPRLLRVDAGAAPDPREMWLVVHDDIRRAPAVRAAADHLIRIFSDEPLFAERR